ncbi:peptidoglycan-recognition protein 3-like [Macrosteles quadrilineatus]|uniref:peptidoglycan-recognition protein 3-like n=1 Tax=Macrosteles quadrilineatus TaxID=74068 RepID=UPI0023E0B4E4|nr:peptidoglycan-recognition protein 3-like [Macrosteles quadrilineatus]
MPLPDEPVSNLSSIEGDAGHEYKYVPRLGWGAEPPRSVRRVGLVNYILCTYTNSRPCLDHDTCSHEIKFVQSKNMQYPDNPDVRYSFLIGGDGAVYEGRGWGILPRAPKRFAGISSRSLYIAFVGKFKFTPPSAKMFKAKDNLILDGVNKGYIDKKILIFTM